MLSDDRTWLDMQELSVRKCKCEYCLVLCCISITSIVASLAGYHDSMSQGGT
jgi:uncharacterized membrane protein